MAQDWGLLNGIKEELAQHRKRLEIIENTLKLDALRDMEVSDRMIRDEAVFAKLKEPEEITMPLSTLVEFVLRYWYRSPPLSDVIGRADIEARLRAEHSESFGNLLHEEERASP